MSNPKSDLEKARKISEKIEENALQANWYAALYERIAFKEDIGKAFGFSFEAWGLIKCSDALLDALIMALTRIVYGDRENTASLLSLLEILKRPGVFELLEQENLEHDCKLPCDLRQLEENVNAIKGDHRLTKINTFRNTGVGHQAIVLDPQKHKLPKYEEPPELLKKIRPVVELCWILLKDPSSDFKGRASVDVEFSSAQKCANEFWEYAAHLRQNLTRED